MSSLPTAYTPLETLLLFQALRAENASSLSVFNNISDQLNRIPLIHNDPSYDSERLSSDALRNLYLRLLKDEAKRELHRGQERNGIAVNGDASPGSRKRKAPSPSPPTVQEAAQHGHLIPQLMTRLYARYRETAVRQIRDLEHHYQDLSRDLTRPGAGTAEEHMHTSGSPGSSAANHTQATTGAGANTAPATPTVNGNAKGDHALPLEAAIRPEPSHKTADARANHQTPSNVAAAGRAEIASPATRLSSNPYGAARANMPTNANGSGYSPSPLGGATAPSAHRPGQPLHPSVVINVQNQYAQSRSSASPAPSPSPARAPSALQASGPHPHARQDQQPHFQQQSLNQYLAHPGTGGEAPPQYGHPKLPHQAGPWQQQQQQQQQQQSNIPYRSPAPPGQYPYQQPIGGQQLPPFPIDAQRPSLPPTSQQMQTSVSPQQHAPRQRPTYPPSAPPTVQRPVSQATPFVSSILNALATPQRGGRPVIWKSERQPSRLQLGSPRPRPGAEPLSPLQSRAELPGRSTRSTRQRDTEGDDSAIEPSEAPRKRHRRGRPKRSPSPQSVASSNADDSARLSRSPSVSTSAGRAAASKDLAGTRDGVKVEPSTPAAFDDEQSAREPSATPASSTRVTRKRRLTLQNQPAPNKRTKRQDSPSVRAEEAPTSPPPAARSSTITAYRNFPKFSGSLMDNINGNKHASYFVNAVRERDAPGYFEIIKRPQNLKAIRAAVTAGGRAVAAALESPSSTFVSNAESGSASSTVELERAEEFCPPRGIVNKAQLEKEVLRMLANAVMFNPGDDGMVRDTREMFDEVDLLMRALPGPEKDRAGSSEANAGMAGGGEEEEEGRGKRRKA